MTTELLFMECWCSSTGEPPSHSINAGGFNVGMVSLDNGWSIPQGIARNRWSTSRCNFTISLDGQQSDATSPLVVASELGNYQVFPF